MGFLGGGFLLGGGPVTPPGPAAATGPIPNSSGDTNLGVDISCYPDFDPAGSLVTGIVALCQRICRRITNVRGAWFWSPNDCTDVRNYLNVTLTKEAQQSIKSDLEREALREEEVSTVNASVTVSTLSTLGQIVTVHLTGTTSSNTSFSFVLAITQLTLTILQAG